MADSTISNLSAGTTPIAGTEELPIVQGGSTVKITAQDIADLAGGDNIGNADLTIDTTGTRKLILGGALSSDTFTIRNSADTQDFFSVLGDGQVYSNGRGSIATNTGYGKTVFNASTTGTQNVGFGEQALTALLGGGKNCAFGYRSGDGLTTATQNNFIGNLCGHNVTTGSNNVTIGYNRQLTTNTRDSVIVGNSGATQVTGSFNTIVGGSAGNGLTTGTYNTIISPYQSSVSIGVTTGNYNVLIGRISGLSSSQSNNIVLNDGQGNQGFRKDANENVILGGESALSTTATDGFVHIPTCAGTPTGTPTTITGSLPMVIDSTNNKMYIYSGGSWVALN